MSNQHLLSVSEFADLCNITAETLRYYDREDLLKPIYTNPQNKYRYYSVEQYRCAKVICELKEQNFSISQIKDIFSCGTTDIATEILIDNLKDVNMQIAQLNKVKENIKSKLDYMNNENLYLDINAIKETTINQQYILMSSECAVVTNYIDMYATISFFEKFICPVVYPKLMTFCNDLYMYIAHPDNGEYNQNTLFSMGITIDKEIKPPAKTHIYKTRKNKCITYAYKGRFFDFHKYIDNLIEYIHEHNYTICGDIIVAAKAGHVLISPCLNMLYEIQVPVTSI